MSKSFSLVLAALKCTEKWRFKGIKLNEWKMVPFLQSYLFFMSYIHPACCCSQWCLTCHPSRIVNNYSSYMMHYRYVAVFKSINPVELTATGDLMVDENMSLCFSRWRGGLQPIKTFVLWSLNLQEQMKTPMFAALLKNHHQRGPLRTNWKRKEHLI